MTELSENEESLSECDPQNIEDSIETGEHCASAAINWPADIDLLSEDEIYDLADQLEIEDYTDFYNLVQKIKLAKAKNDIANGWLKHYMQDEYLKRIKTQIEQSKHRRKHLLKLLNDTNEIYQKIMNLKQVDRSSKTYAQIESAADPLMEAIKNKFPNFDEVLNKLIVRANDIENCSILLAGEACAGKSSFINLLLGFEEDLLPTSIDINSSTFLKIRYDTRRHAEFTDHHGNIESINDGPDFVERIRKYVENKSASRRERATCKEAVLYCPSQLLEHGLQLYDSIGFGETTEFNQMLKDYLHESCGFIYLIRKNAPIGEKGMGGLYEYVQHLTNNFFVYHQASVTFIVNMMDDINQNDPEIDSKLRVINHAREQIKKLWPVTEDQVLSFSTTDAKYMAMQNVVSEEYAKVKMSIKKLWMNSINTVNCNMLGFTQNFNHCCLEIIDSFLEHTHQQAQLKNRENRLKDMRAQLRERKRQNNLFQNECEKVLAKASKDILKTIREHLSRDSEARQRIVEYVQFSEERPVEDELQKIDKKLSEICRQSILKELESFEQSNEHFRKCRDEIIQMFIKTYNKFTQFANTMRQDLQGLGQDGVNADLAGGNDTMCIDTSNIDQNLPQLSEKEINGILMDITTNFNSIPKQYKILLSILAPVVVPAAVVLALPVLPVVIVRKLYCVFLGKLEQDEMKRYLEKPMIYIRTLVTKMLQKYVRSRGELRAYVQKRIQMIEQVVLKFNEHLNNEIDELEGFIELLEQETREYYVILSAYGEMQSKLRHMKENFNYLKLMHLQTDIQDEMEEEFEIEKDFEGEEINLCQSKIRRIVKGKFNSTDPTRKCEISIMRFIQNHNYQISTNQMLVEFEENFNKCSQISCEYFVRPLHCIKFPMDNVDLGDYSPAPEPLLVIEAVHCSLKQALKHKKEEIMQEFSDYKWQSDYFDYLRECMNCIFGGLEYLHAKKLVYFDLSLDSVAVSYECTSLQSAIPRVKLINMTQINRCVPVEFSPQTCDYIVANSHYAPEVLVRSHLAPTNRNSVVDVPQVDKLPTTTSSTTTTSTELRQIVYEPSADLWSLGVLLHEAWSLVRPYFNAIHVKDITEIEVFSRHVKNNSLQIDQSAFVQSDNLSYHSVYSDAMFTFIQLLMKVNPRQRKSCAEMRVFIDEYVRDNFGKRSVASAKCR